MSDGFRDYLAKEVARIGWREFVRRSDGEFTSGALQGWLRGALPLPSHQVAIAKIVALPLESIRDMVWRAEVAREEGRQPRPFRTDGAHQETRGGSALGRQARRADPRPAARVRKPRGGGLAGLVTVGLLTLAAPAVAAPVWAREPAYEASSVDQRRRRAA
jgi:hypothetical protein